MAYTALASGGRTHGHGVLELARAADRCPSASARRPRGLPAWCRIAALVIGSVLALGGAAAAQTLDAGFTGPSYPNGLAANLTGEKPESKLWFNDGRWWGSLWSTSGDAYHIWYRNPSTNQWVDTGTEIDSRTGSKADALWDQATNKLYVVSHIFGSGDTASAGNRGELYRYSYSSVTKTYTLDPGFPVEVNQARSEELVIAKDSTGQLWVVWVQDSQVMVNRTVGSDTSWGTPFVLPIGSTATVGSDDIADIVAFDSTIGVMWSHQGSPSSARGMYFASHPDSQADTSGWTSRRIYSPSEDDHISLKVLSGDPAGKVFAAIKTSDSDALIVLLVCENSNASCTGSDWTDYPVYTTSANDATRPILLLDTHNREAYVFVRAEPGVDEAGIYYKKVRLEDLQSWNSDSAFSGNSIGTLFIGITSDVNDPTSTKQNLTAETGMLVLASDHDVRRYYFGFASLGSGGPPPDPVPVAAFVGTPTTGTAPLSVQFTDQSTNGPTSWSWDFGDGLTSTLQHPEHTYTAPGLYTVRLTASNAAGPSAPAVRTDYIAVGSTSGGGGGGTVAFGAVWSNGASGSVVSTSITSSPAGEARVLLAAVATRPNRPVSTVTGAGLSWTRLAAQCGGRNQTGLEVWMAYGVGVAGAVTATLDSSASSVVLAVTAYTGAAPGGPVGAAIPANSNGVNGACSGGTDQSAYSIAVAPSATNAVIYSAATMRNKSHSPGPAYTERVELTQGSSGDTASIVAQDSASAAAAPLVADGTFDSTVDWAAIALEIRPGAGSSGDPEPPVAAFAGDPTNGTAPLTVEFTDQSTNDPTGWSWDFGDGNTSTEQHPTHTYTDPGIYTVQLTASNGEGSSAPLIKTGYIAVGAPPAPPVAAFTGTPTSGTAPLAVQFTDQSTNGPTAWSWDFGDGGTSTEQHPSHTYVVPGVYTVQLTASNADGSGAPAVMTDYIDVGDAPLVTVPDVVGDTESEASAALAAADLTTGSITHASSDTVPSGRVISQDPAADTQVAEGSPVALVISTGPPSSGGVPTFQGVWSGGASGAVVSAAVNPAAEPRVLLAAVATRPYRSVSAVTGAGLSWTRLAAQCGGRNQTGVELWVAHGVPAVGTVTATLDSSASSVVMAVSSYAGAASVNPVGVPVAANSNGVSGACSGGTDNTAYAIPVTPSVTNALIYSAATMRNKAHSPGTAFIERLEETWGSSGDTVSVATQDSASSPSAPTVADGFFSGTVDWAAVAVEIRP